MARRKRAKITYRNIATRLTRKGTYYIDFSRLDILSRLSQRQRTYLNIASQEKKVLFINREEYHSMTREAQLEYLGSILDILSGKQFRSKSSDIIKGYVRALMQNGLVDLGKAMESMADGMDAEREFRFISQLPRIEEVYPPRSRKGRKKSDEPYVPDNIRSNAIKQIIKVMKRYGYKLDKKTEIYCETFDIKLDED